MIRNKENTGDNNSTA